MFSKELEDKIDEYNDFFGEDNDFPVYAICRGKDEKTVISIIDVCLKQKKDAYELGFAEEEVYY